MSSGILYLTSEDFTVSKGQKGSILSNFIQGFSLILFYSPSCPHCQQLLPIFKRLPNTVASCQFGTLNVSTNKGLVQASQSTVSPITYVPLIILYVNGKPFLKYAGPADIDEIKRFVIEVSKNIQSKQQFSKKEVKEDPKSSIPAYCLGKPLYGDDGKDRTYLVFDSVKGYK